MNTDTPGESVPCDVPLASLPSTTVEICLKAFSGEIVAVYEHDKQARFRKQKLLVKDPQTDTRVIVLVSDRDEISKDHVGGIIEARPKPTSPRSLLWNPTIDNGPRSPRGQVQLRQNCPIIQLTRPGQQISQPSLFPLPAQPSNKHGDQPVQSGRPSTLSSESSSTADVSVEELKSLLLDCHQATGDVLPILFRDHKATPAESLAVTLALFAKASPQRKGGESQTVQSLGRPKLAALRARLRANSALEKPLRDVLVSTGRLREQGSVEQLDEANAAVALTILDSGIISPAASAA